MKFIPRIGVLATLGAFIAGVLTSCVVLAQNYPTTAVKSKHEIVVITFLSDNCPYCRDAMPTWDLLRKDGMTIVTANAERDPAMFDRWNVKRVPTTLVALRDVQGTYREMLRVGGSRPLPEYQAMIKRGKERIAAGVDPWPTNLKEDWPLPMPEATK